MIPANTMTTAESVEWYKGFVLEALQKKGDSLELSDLELVAIATAWSSGTPSYVCAAVLSCERFYVMRKAP